MSWNIEVEVEQAVGGMVLHCSSMSVVWKSKLKKQVADVKALARAMSGDIDVMEAGIPKDVDTSTAASVEFYLNQCGCTAEAVANDNLHIFMDMPVSVREGLKVVSKGKGIPKVRYTGAVSCHPRFVRRVPTKMIVNVCVDPHRGGWIVLKQKAADGSPTMTFKITASTLVELVPALNNTFVLKFNQRQWVLQMSEIEEFEECCNAINQILKSLSKKPLPVGFVKEELLIEEKKEAAKEAEEKELLCPYMTTPYSEEVSERLKQDNARLDVELDQLKEESLNMETTIEELRKQFMQLEAGDKEMADAITAEMSAKKADWMLGFKQEIHNLQKHVKELKPMLKAESAVATTGDESTTTEAGAENPAGGGPLSAAGATQRPEEKSEKALEDRVDIDLESRIIATLDPVDAGRLRFKHFHVHKHQYQHSHVHKHVHLDQDFIAKMDDVKSKFRHKHVLRHTTTHTQTQYLVPKRWFNFGFGGGRRFGKIFGGS